jgi:type IV secretory pathway TraG/TraD family ATPase VirD4
LLHASALANETLARALWRVDTRDIDAATDTLATRYPDTHPALTSLRSVLATEERERSSIFSTTAGLFAGLRTDAARRASEAPPLDLDAFFAAPHQLHIVAPARHQAVAVPLVVGLIEEVVHATYHRPAARLLLALDEVANIAPLPRLASIVAEGGGQGVVTLACLQDLSQARARWGVLGEGFVSLFPTTVVLGGVADRTTLEHLSRLVGEVASPQLTQRRRERSVTWVRQPRLSPRDIAVGRAGHALVLDARRQPSWVTLTPAHEDARFHSPE